MFPNNSTRVVTVAPVRLDDFYRSDVPTVVKIDIEGGEYRALRSATRFVQSHNTSFFIELHGWGDRTIRKYPLHIAWFFLTQGYAVRKIGTHYWFYRASRPKCLATFLGQCPYLGAKYLAFRYMKEIRSAIATSRRTLRSRR